MSRTYCCSSLISIFLIVLTLSFLSGCGEEKKMKVIHSCQVFSEAEIRKLIDPSVEWPPKETHREDAENDHWMSMCNYFSGETGLSASVMIQPYSPRTLTAKEAMETYRSSTKENLPDYEMKETGSNGSTALWNPEMGQFTLFTEKHMLLLGIMKKDMGEEVKLSFCQKLAEALLAKGILKE